MFYTEQTFITLTSPSVIEFFAIND